MFTTCIYNFNKLINKKNNKTKVKYIEMTMSFHNILAKNMSTKTNYREIFNSLKTFESQKYNNIYGEQLVK